MRTTRAPTTFKNSCRTPFICSENVAPGWYLEFLCSDEDDQRGPKLQRSIEAMRAHHPQTVWEARHYRDQLSEELGAPWSARTTRLYSGPLRPGEHTAKVVGSASARQPIESSEHCVDAPWMLKRCSL